MPYVTCHHCRLTVYTAAFRTRVDECPGCGAVLPTPHRAKRERRLSLPRRPQRTPLRPSGGGGSPAA